MPRNPSNHPPGQPNAWEIGCVLAGLPEAQPNWRREGGDFIAPADTPHPGADEDAVNAAIEGASDLTAPTSLTAVQSGDAEHDLSAVKKIAMQIRIESPSAQGASAPPGAIDRLRLRLAEVQERGEGGASPVVARRIVAQLRGEAARPPAAFRPPDVLAAGQEPEDPEEPPIEQDEPSDT